MFENADTKKIINKEEYKLLKKKYEEKLGELQRKLKELKIPVIILLEGWGASGKGTLINKIILPLDPRGINVYTTNKLKEEEKFRPFLWTFFTKTPERGRITIFDKSWYRRMLGDRFNDKIEKTGLNDKYVDIKQFEKQLIDDGNIIIKFFLHITKDEQAKRFKKLESEPATSWRVQENDWKQNNNYDRYLEHIEDMIKNTNTEYSPWNVIEADDSKFATINAFEIIIKKIETEINKQQEEKIQPTNNKNFPCLEYYNTIEIPPVLSTIDLSHDMDKSEYKRKLEEHQKEICHLENMIYTRRIPVVIVYEGWDASGKGGNIKKLTEKMDPRGYDVIPIAAPTDLEKAHHYLWRFWNTIPKDGHIAIFDRSWYGRVMVERVEGFCSEEEWKRAYKEINDMERQLANHGAVIIKFWLHIDKEEQLKRFTARQNDPNKQWKITEEDWRNREKWDDYETAVNEMLFRTSTEYAPWTIIESNSKRYARIKAIEKVIKEIKKKL